MISEKVSYNHYREVHRWIKKQLGPANKCKNCDRKMGTFEWSNISQEYKYDISDWQMLCKQCHFVFDYNLTYPAASQQKFPRKIVHPLGWTDKQLRYMAEINRDEKTGKVLNISSLYRNMGYTLQSGNPVPRDFQQRVYALLDQAVGQA